MVKLELADTPQGVEIYDGANRLWTGKSGQIALFPVDGPTRVLVRYQLGIMDAPKSCEGIIDPAISRKWVARADNDRFVSRISLLPTESFENYFFETETFKYSATDEKKMARRIRAMNEDGWELFYMNKDNGFEWTLIFKRRTVSVMPVVESNI